MFRITGSGMEARTRLFHSRGRFILLLDDVRVSLMGCTGKAVTLSGTIVYTLAQAGMLAGYGSVIAVKDNPLPPVARSIAVGTAGPLEPTVGRLVSPYHPRATAPTASTLSRAAACPGGPPAV